MPVRSMHWCAWCGRIAPITHVGTAHIEHFDFEADIARAKGEIFNDMANDVVRVAQLSSPQQPAYRPACRIG